MLKQTSFPLGKSKSNNMFIEGVIVTSILLYFASKIYENYFIANQNSVNN